MLFSDPDLPSKHNPRPFVPVLIAITIFVLLVGNSPQGRAQSLQTDGVQYPNSDVAFICGPQLKSDSSLNPAPWFDSTARSMGVTQGERNPRSAPVGPMSLESGTWQNVIRGQVGISAGSLTVNGSGTAFTRDVDANGQGPHYNGRLRIRDSGGVVRSVQVKSVESDTQLTLMTAWAFGSVSNTVADTYHVDASEGPNTDHYYSDNYYDTALVQYINYYRTGEARFLEYARKTADAWWHSQWVGDGTVTGGPHHLPPRSMAFAGLMLRALDGRPEMWDYLEREVHTNFEVWVYLRKNNPTLFYDIREDGYAQLYAVMLAKVLPDSYPLQANGTLQASTGLATDGAVKRSRYLTQTEDTAVNFFGRLQRGDGSWRWDADTSSDPNDQFREVEQPFMVGLYLESVVLLHQLTTNAQVKTQLVNQLTRSVQHLYHDAYEKNDPVTNYPGYNWRGFFYFWGGGTVAEPNKYNPPSRWTTACGLSNCGDGSVTSARHLNSTIHHAFGYAYYVTGEQQYKEMGDEVFDASYGEEVDGLHSLAASGKGKDYAMNYRASGHYLVWQLAAAGSPTPSPTPSPVPTPTGSPTPAPSPTPTPVNGSTSTASVLRAKDHATVLAGQMDAGAPVLSHHVVISSPTTSFNLELASDLEALTNDIVLAHADFVVEIDEFGTAASGIETQLSAAVLFARTNAALAFKTGNTASVAMHLDRIVSHLTMAEDLMLYGSISSMTAAQAIAARARLNLVIGNPVAGYDQQAPGPLAPSSLSLIFGNGVLPLCDQASSISASGSGPLQYELGGVSVVIAGQAAQLVYVSSSQLAFIVPAEVSLGNVEVIVTSQEGHLSRGAATIARNVFRIMTSTTGGTTQAVAMNLARESNGFDVMTSQNFGPDKRTRIALVAVGVTGGAANSDTSNDIQAAGISLLNFAESVTVEARLSSGQVLSLPVEFAGARPGMIGLDQVNVRLTSELRAAGTVELTLIVGGQRSNSATIFIR